MKISNIEVAYIDHCGTDLSVSNAARVSFDKTSELVEEFYLDAQGQAFTYKTLAQKDVKLINYLAKHKHYSPFNHTFITVRVKAPLYVARQLV